MFTQQTQNEISLYYPQELGVPGTVVLSSQAYQELIHAARIWHSRNVTPISRGAHIQFIPQPDGSLKIGP